MRCDLVTRDGVTLGKLVLADGVTLAEVGRALLDRQAVAVQAEAEEPPAEKAPSKNGKPK